MEQSQAVVPFMFKGYELRHIIQSDEPWWVARDVCAILNIKNVNHAVNGNPSRDEEGLDEDERGYYIVTTPGGPQEMLCVNEPGLYRLIFKSRKQEALDFKRYVYHVILPSIRKTGNYTIAQDQRKQQRVLFAQRNKAAIEAQIQKLFPERRTYCLTPDDYTSEALEKRVLHALSKIGPGWHTARAISQNGSTVLRKIGAPGTRVILNCLVEIGKCQRKGTGKRALYGLPTTDCVGDSDVIPYRDGIRQADAIDSNAIDVCAENTLQEKAL